MRIGELAFKIHVHRVHAWRLARAGVVPGMKKTKGGHFYFVKSRSLSRWINFMQSGGAFRKKEMTRAYLRGYGGKRPENDEQIKCWKLFRDKQKKFADFRREHKDYKNEYDDLFSDFFYNTDDLIRVLKELVTWSDCRVKSGMVKASSKRLTVLRDLINVWIGHQDNSQKPSA